MSKLLHGHGGAGPARAHAVQERRRASERPQTRSEDGEWAKKGRDGAARAAGYWREKAQA
jgi:hypothetical protein